MRCTPALQRTCSNFKLTNINWLYGLYCLFMYSKYTWCAVEMTVRSTRKNVLVDYIIPGRYTIVKVKVQYLVPVASEYGLNRISRDPTRVRTHMLLFESRLALG